MYVDSDDYLPYNAVEKLLSAALVHRADIAIGEMTRVLDNKGIIKKRNTKYNLIDIDHNELIEKYYISFFGVNILPVSMCAKIYKKEMLDAAIVEKTGLHHGEDLCYNMQVFPYANKVVVIPDAVYYYRWGGMTSKMNYGLFDEARKAYRLKQSMIRKYHVKRGDEFIAYELKNFFITYMESFILYTRANETEIINDCFDKWKSAELQNAISVINVLDKNYDEQTNCVINGDLDKLYNIIQVAALKKKVKNFFIKIIGALLNLL